MYLRTRNGRLEFVDSTSICSKCHQPINHERLGVRLSPLKARIIDLIKAAGDIGISTGELLRELYHPSAQPKSVNTVRMHICQINDVLVETDWVIVADPARGPTARWHLWRRPAEAAE